MCATCQKQVVMFLESSACSVQDMAQGIGNRCVNRDIHGRTVQADGNPFLDRYVIQ